MDWLNILLPGLFGLAGTGVGGWVTAKTQRQQLKHTDQAQWDKDIVRIVGDMIATSRKMPHLSLQYFIAVDWPENEDLQQGKSTANRELGELLQLLYSHAAQLELISKKDLGEAALTFVNDCNERYCPQFEVVNPIEGDINFVAQPEPNESVDIAASTRRLITATKNEIRLGTSLH